MSTAGVKADALIIGTGPTGAVAAKRLAEAGMRVVVLEQGDWSLLDGDGPLWYRGYALAEEAAIEAPFTAFLARWDIDRIVVGHTVNRDSRVHSRLAGRIFLIDTGMLTPGYKGMGSALDFEGTAVQAIYGDGRREDVVAPAPTPQP